MNEQLEKARAEKNREWLINLEGERGNLYLDKLDVEENIRYAEGWEQYHVLDVYAPKGKMREKLPVIVDIHGGGYVFCLKETNLIQARWFAMMGYKVVNINYRLFPEADCRGIQQDVFTVFHWMEENAEAYGFDLTKTVGVTGDSAGGHIVLLTALLNNNYGLRTLYNVEKPSFSMKIAATCPACNLKVPEIGQEKWIFSGFTEEQLAEMRKFTSFSIYDLTDAFAMPEVMLIATPGDGLCYNDDLHFHDFLLGKKLPHVYREYYNQSHDLKHVFNVTFPEWEESVAANTDILRYFKGEL